MTGNQENKHPKHPMKKWDKVKGQNSWTMFKVISEFVKLNSIVFVLFLFNCMPVLLAKESMSTIVFVVCNKLLLHLLS